MRHHPLLWRDGLSPMTQSNGLIRKYALVDMGRFQKSCIVDFAELELWKLVSLLSVLSVFLRMLSTTHEIKAGIRNSRWCGRDLAPQHSWGHTRSPHPPSFFFSYKRLYCRAGYTFAHLGGTQSGVLSNRSSKQEFFFLKKIAAQRRIKKMPPLLQPKLCYMWSIHQAEASVLNHLFSKDVYDAVCQLAAPSGAPGKKHRFLEGLPITLPPSQLEAKQTDNPKPPQHRPNDFYIKQPDVLLCHPPIPFQYWSIPKWAFPALYHEQ